MDRFDQAVTPVQRAPDRRGRLAAGLLMVAVLAAGVALLAVAQPFAPAPSPLAPIGLVLPSSSGFASPSASRPASSSTGPTGHLPPPGSSVPPPPTALPTVPPTYPPDAFADMPEWRVSLTAADARDPVVALIVDPDRRVIGGARAPMRFFAAGFKGGVLPAGSDHAVDVYWASSTCAPWETVTLDPDGTITVNATPSDTVCAPSPAMRGLELRFAANVDAKDFSLFVGPEHRYPPDLGPVAAAFSDATHGVVALANGLAGVADTADGGQSWRYTIIGDGTTTGVALSGQTAWTAIACDPSVWDHCAAGVYRRDDGVWTRVHAMNPGLMAVQGDAVAVFDQPLSVDAGPTGVELSGDGGVTWRSIPQPCSVGQPTGIALDGRLVVVCQAASYPDGTSDKALWAAQDEAATIWAQAVLPTSGTKAGISMAPGGTGVLWGTKTPPLLTTDGGGTWTASPNVGGDLRVVRSGDAQPTGAVTLLVWDPDRNATLLLRTTNAGAAWTELSSFRDLPCCGG